MRTGQVPRKKKAKRLRLTSGLEEMHMHWESNCEELRGFSNYYILYTHRGTMKFPSQRKFQYTTGTISNDGWTGPDSTNAGYLNIVKDLSCMNRRGYASTTKDGTPLVFRCKVDIYLQDEDGFGINAAVGSDFMTTLKIDGAQNNWVMMQASKKWHAARNNMFKRAGITSKSRGAYSKEIRYNYKGASDTWLVPIDGDGDAMTQGTWDASTMVTVADADFNLKITGIGLDEESSAAATAINIGHSYLMSRTNQLADTNPEASEGPADLSILRSLLMDDEPSGVRIDDINAEARDAQDNPPYEVLDLSDSGDVNHSITEPVELGRAVAGLGNAYGSVIVDIPFGLAELKVTHYDAADTNITSGGLICVEVLDIYEMQG